MFLLAAPLILGCPSTDRPASAPDGNPQKPAPSTAAPSAKTERVAAPAAGHTAGKQQPAAPLAGKEWKDPAGNVLAVGEFVSLMDGKVCLQTPDGLGVAVPLEELCQADRKLVEQDAAADLTVPQEPEVEVEEMIEPMAATTPGADAADGSEQQKVVIPFDFVSRFDDGSYGGKIGEMIVKKIQGQGTFAVPDAIDIRDQCARHGVKITPDTPPAEIRRVLRDLFEAQIAIWGSCEKAAGQQWDVYDLTIRCADFSAGGEPTMLYEKVNVRTKTVSEIPHLYVAEMLKRLYGREPDGPAPSDPLAEQNWRDNPNLVENGSFEAGTRAVPDGWEDRGGQDRLPLGTLVHWTTESGNPGNHVIRFTFDASVGDGFGVMYYSRPFPVEEGARYRFQCRYRTNGPTVKVFIKCGEEMGSDYKPAGGADLARDPLAQTEQPEYIPRFGYLRECYRSQQNLKGGKNQWHTHTQDFTPKHTRYTPRWGRVMLYAYLGGGVVEFDDIVIKQIVPASASDQKKDPRHSQDSSVTIKEMEENERRARQPEAKPRQ